MRPNVWYGRIVAEDSLLGLDGMDLLMVPLQALVFGSSLV